MTKKKIEIISFSIIIVCTIACFVIDYREKKREQQERMEAIHQSELKKIAYVTTGHYYIFSDIINPGFDTGYVITLVTLYNECIDRGVQEGEKISGYTEVYKEYEDYMSGRTTYEECGIIRMLCAFHEAEHCYRKYDLGDYEFYIQLVGMELGNSVGDIYSDYTRHTDIEVEAASKMAAKKWCDYMEGK